MKNCNKWTSSAPSCVTPSQLVFLLSDRYVGFIHVTMVNLQPYFQTKNWQMRMCKTSQTTAWRFASLFWGLVVKRKYNFNLQCLQFRMVNRPSKLNIIFRFTLARYFFLGKWIFLFYFRWETVSRVAGKKLNENKNAKQTSIKIQETDFDFDKLTCGRFHSGIRNDASVFPSGLLLPAKRLCCSCYVPNEPTARG